MRVATTTPSGPVALLDPPASNPENSHPGWTKPRGPVTFMRHELTESWSMGPRSRRAHGAPHRGLDSPDLWQLRPIGHQAVPRQVRARLEELLGDLVILDLGSRSASVLPDEPTAEFVSSSVYEVHVTPAESCTIWQARRAVVELRQFSGQAPHALLGGVFHPDEAGLRVRVASTSATHRRTCRSQLRRRRLIPGLPPEFGAAAADGLLRTIELGPGVLTVDRAGYDPVETSQAIVELAAEILGRVLSLPGKPIPTDEQLRAWLEALP